MYICIYIYVYLYNGGTPKSSILVGLSILNQPFLGTSMYGNTQKSLSKVLVALHLQLCSGRQQTLLLVAVEGDLLPRSHEVLG